MTFLQEEEVFPAVNFSEVSVGEEVNAPGNAFGPTKGEDANGSSEVEEGDQSSKRKLSDKEANKKVCSFYFVLLLLLMVYHLLIKVYYIKGYCSDGL